MKNKMKIVIALLVIVTLAVVAYIFLQGGDEIIISAKTIAVKKANVTTMVTATGTIEPIKQVDVGTQVSGVVKKIYVDYNSVVKAGQLIAELDKTNLKAAYSQAQASYDNAINQREYMKIIYNRQKSLYDDQFISKSDFDVANFNYETAKNTVTQQFSDLQRSITNLSYANIYSPIDGVILSKDIDEGQTVAASFNTPTLFTIAQDLKEMQVEANVDEADIGQVKEGQRVTFTVDAYIGETFEGVVSQVRLDPKITSNVVTYTVVITTKNPDLKLKPGLTATISIFTLELNNVLTVEAKAINFKPDTETLKTYNLQHKLTANSQESSNNNSIIWVLDIDGAILPRTVILGASDGVNVQILSGVTKGEKIVYSLKGVNKSEINKDGPNESPFVQQGGRPNRI
ncbi:MAG: efflux RND transporter periplasmic adaptor subunit [Candidatus Kapaibacterium sp.]